MVQKSSLYFSAGPGPDLTYFEPDPDIIWQSVPDFIMSVRVRILSILSLVRILSFLSLGPDFIKGVRVAGPVPDLSIFESRSGSGFYPSSPGPGPIPDPGPDII